MAVLRTIAALSMLLSLIGCSARPWNWTGTVDCVDLSSAECDAGVDAIFEALGSSAAPLPVAIEIASGAACAPDWAECSYGLLPGQRLFGHGVVDFGTGIPKVYVNLRVSEDGSVGSDTVRLP